MGKYCDIYGYDDDAIRARLTFLSLTEADNRLALRLQHEVITPYASDIIDGFYHGLEENDDFNRIISQGFDIERLKRTQTYYLLSLGVDFNTISYFEERLRIGIVHAHVGIPLGIYECAYRLLRQLIIDHIPEKIRTDPQEYTDLIQFILKITSLDISLTTETYHQTRVYGLEQSLHALRHEDQRLRKMIEIDRLTGVGSRENILKYLEESLHLSQKHALPLCLVMADLDHFKQINDKYGHLVGDQVLRGVAARMLAATRDIDSLGRFGGEEFIVVLQTTSLDTALVVCERIRHRVADTPISVTSEQINMTVSQGLVEAGQHESVDNLITRADRTLYAAKEAGRNRVIVDDQCDDSKAV